MMTKKYLDSHGLTTIKKQASVWFICIQCLDVFYEGNNYHHPKLLVNFKIFFRSCKSSLKWLISANHWNCLSNWNGQGKSRITQAFSRIILQLCWQIAYFVSSSKVGLPSDRVSILSCYHTQKFQNAVLHWPWQCNVASLSYENDFGMVVAKQLRNDSKWCLEPNLDQIKRKFWMMISFNNFFHISQVK